MNSRYAWGLNNVSHPHAGNEGMSQAKHTGHSRSDRNIHWSIYPCGVSCRGDLVGAWGQGGSLVVDCEGIVGGYCIGGICEWSMGAKVWMWWQRWWGKW